MRTACRSFQTDAGLAEPFIHLPDIVGVFISFYYTSSPSAGFLKRFQPPHVTFMFQSRVCCIRGLSKCCRSFVSSGTTRRVNLRMFNCEPSVQSSNSRVTAAAYLTCDVTSADEQFGKANTMKLCFSKYSVSQFHSDQRRLFFKKLKC